MASTNISDKKIPFYCNDSNIKLLSVLFWICTLVKMPINKIVSFNKPVRELTCRNLFSFTDYLGVPRLALLPAEPWD